jgi:hypothetical protein
MEEHSENQKIQASQRSLNTLQETNIPTPPVLYKYYAFDEWTQNIFERNEIYFQSPDCFNDPFDSKISTTYKGTEEQRIYRLIELWRKGPAKDEQEEGLRSRAVDVVKKCQDVTLIQRSSERSVERLRKRMGIFCMTSKRDDILMWSHYADCHRGFCLEFRTEKLFFARAQFVTYCHERPCLNMIESQDDPYKVADALLTKAEDWRYEYEWRIVDHTNGPGIQIYPSESLSGVILGCRISPENRQRITQWCHAHNPRPAIYWAEEKDREFGLDIILIC